ncbi:MAG: acyl transferase [Bacteroidetes bacterium]|nr:acyl transferase [Bacteroidota bacterium]
MNTREIFFPHDIDSFNETALKIFQYQYLNNLEYNKFCALLGKSPQNVKDVLAIPFLPIDFFKRLKIVSGTRNEEIIFKSSATTSTIQSSHYISDLSVYKQSYIHCFKLFYGDPSDYCILALLPSYLERDGSSLIYMVKDLIERSNNPDSGFYLNNTGDLIEKLKIQESKGQKTLLFGVTFALIDFAQEFKYGLKTTIIIETGGMKGRKKEMIREEVHSILSEAFNVHGIHSEYGMTELLSQAYSLSNGVFRCPPWMKILIRNTQDPFEFLSNYKTGGINVIDFANINSCSFISTQDLGKTFDDGTFEVLGRFDHSDIRGCNLLI